MNRAVRTIFDITITFGVVCAAISFFLMSRQDRPAWWLLVFLIVAGGIGEYATIVGDEEEGEHGFSFATTAHLTAAMLLMPGWAAPVAALGSMAGECSRRARPLVIALNGALATIATLAASAVFHGVQGSGTFGLQSYLAVGAMLLVFIPLNLFPPGLAATIVSQKAVRPLAWLPPADLLTYVTEACLAASITLVVKTAPAFLFFLIPLLIAMFLSLKRARLLSRETRYTLRALVSVIDAKDPSTAAHSERVGDLSARLAEALGLGGRDVRNIRWAGRLHDIGKVAVDDAILQKGSQLDALEWEAMRRHPAVGAELLEPLGLTRVLTPAIRFHHERADGNGYYLLPEGEIPLHASVLAIADAFDAMTSHRSYRAALSYDDALGRIEAASGTQFHPALAAAFVAMMRGQQVEPLRSDLDGWRGAIGDRLNGLRRSREETREAKSSPGALRTEL